MDKYTTWEAVPDHLATKSQLGKAGLKLAPGQQPAAIKMGGYGPYDLYDKGTAVPKRASSQAQIEAARRNIEKAQAARQCVDCGIYGQWLKDGRCSDCRRHRAWQNEQADQDHDRHHHWVQQQSSQAGWELAALAAVGDWLILDTETTGLDGTAEVVQVGIVSSAGQQLLNQLIRPSGDIEPEATAVHGLDAAALATAPTWSEVYQDVAQLINGRRLLAYNADFDCRMIRQTCQLYGLPMPQAAEWVCVMELCAAYLGIWSAYHGNFKYVSLGDACSLANVSSYGEDGRHLAHDAAGDALLTWRLVQSFRQEQLP